MTTKHRGDGYDQFRIDRAKAKRERKAGRRWANNRRAQDRDEAHRDRMSRAVVWIPTP
jgi:hypothetical protein